MKNVTRLLLIDNNMEDQGVVKDHLRNSPNRYTVETAATLKLAQTFLKEKQYDIAILDLDLPDSSGLKTLTNLLNCAPTLPVIVLTSLEDDETGRSAIKAGAQDYLVKGTIDPHSLNRSLLYALERHNIRLKNELYRSITMQSAECMILFEVSGKILEVNKSACLAYGYSRDIFLQRSMKEIDPNFHQQINDTRFDEIMGRDKFIAFETMRRKSDGSLFHADVRLSKVEYEGRTLIQGLCRDVSEKKKATEIMHNHRRFLQTLIDAIPIPVYYKDTTKSYIGCNTAYAHYLDREKSEIIGSTVFDLFPEEHAHLYDIKDVELFSSLGTQHYETVMKKWDGTVCNILLNKATYNDLKGKTAGIIGTIIDITEHKEMEIRLYQAHKMESIGTLAGGIAHDFNNLLTTIIGFSQMALDDIENDTQLADDLTEVHNAGIRAKDLVRQILTFARKSDYDCEPIQPGSVIKEALQMIRSTLPSTIEIRQTLDSDSYILAAPTQINQIIVNLCTNAAQAMEDSGGLLDITIRDVTLPEEHKKHLEIRVADTGPGIPVSIIDKIFDPYFTTRSLTEGTGLGLAVVQGIVETINGNIIVKSDQETGSSFIIHIPCISQQKKEIVVSKNELPRGNERILCVDDEASIIKMEGAILSQLGYSVTKFTSSVDALEEFYNNPDHYDLLLTDMTMPKMDGLDLIEKIKGANTSIPVILCTGYSSKIRKSDLPQRGINKLMEKPIGKEELALAVRETLDSTKG